MGSMVILLGAAILSAATGPLGAILPLAILPMLFAVGVFTGQNWARILMLIGAVVDIVSVVGIIWGIIVLWYFTRPHVVAYFKQP